MESTGASLSWITFAIWFCLVTFYPFLSNLHKRFLATSIHSNCFILRTPMASMKYCFAGIHNILTCITATNIHNISTLLHQQFHKCNVNVLFIFMSPASDAIINSQLILTHANSVQGRIFLSSQTISKIVWGTYMEILQRKKTYYTN